MQNCPHSKPVTKIITKKYHSYVIGFTLFFIFTTIVLAKQESTPIMHFFDTRGTPLPEYESIWKQLKKFYGGAMPARFTVKLIDIDNKGSSFNADFNVAQNLISIDRQYSQEEKKRYTAHEASHICLYRLTNGASFLNRFRFIDEGLADILSQRVMGNLDHYKFNRALPAAALQLYKDNVSFKKVQNWREYFGTPETGFKWYAYHVGASFDFFIIDIFSEEKLKELLIDIGSSRNLATAISKTLGKSLKELENEWQAYLPAVEESQVKKFFPANDS